MSNSCVVHMDSGNHHEHKYNQTRDVNAKTFLIKLIRWRDGVRVDAVWSELCSYESRRRRRYHCF